VGVEASLFEPKFKFFVQEARCVGVAGSLLPVFSLGAQHEATRRWAGFTSCRRGEGSAERSCSAGIEIRQRVVFEQPAPAIGDGDQLHLAAAMVASHRRFFDRLGLGLFREDIAPAQVEPDQHPDPASRSGSYRTRPCVDAGGSPCFAWIVHIGWATLAFLDGGASQISPSPIPWPPRRKPASEGLCEEGLRDASLLSE